MRTGGDDALTGSTLLIGSTIRQGVFRMKHRRQTGKTLNRPALDHAKAVASNNLDLEVLLFDIERLQSQLDKVRPQVLTLRQQWTKLCKNWLWQRGAVDVVDAYDELGVRLDVLANSLDKLLNERTPSSSTTSQKAVR